MMYAYDAKFHTNQCDVSGMVDNSAQKHTEYLHIGRTVLVFLL